jgi:MFS family permease
MTGPLIDRYGTSVIILVLSSCICMGQFLFTYGIHERAVWLMYMGRLLFGIGGESLSVAQSRVTTRWFQDKELALAIGKFMFSC